MNEENKEPEQEQQEQCWDEVQYWENEIWPKLKEVEALCAQRRIPFFATAITKNNEQGTGVSAICHIDKRNGEFTARMVAMSTIFPAPSNPFLTSALGTLAEIAKKAKQD